MQFFPQEADGDVVLERRHINIVAAAVRPRTRRCMRGGRRRSGRKRSGLFVRQLSPLVI